VGDTEYQGNAPETSPDPSASSLRFSVGPSNLFFFLRSVLSGYPIWGLTFAFTGGVIMTCWAIERHEEYEIGDGKKGKLGGVRRTTPIFPGVDLRPPRFLVDSLRRK
jgi:hypothetical protein